jgi:hypothetical protein
MRLSTSCPTPNLEGQTLTSWCASPGRLAYAKASPPYPLVVAHSLSESSCETFSAWVALPIAMLLPICFNVNLWKGSAHREEHFIPLVICIAVMIGGSGWWTCVYKVFPSTLTTYHQNWTVISWGVSVNLSVKYSWVAGVCSSCGVTVITYGL